MTERWTSYREQKRTIYSTAAKTSQCFTLALLIFVQTLLFNTKHTDSGISKGMEKNHRPACVSPSRMRSAPRGNPSTNDALTKNPQMSYKYILPAPSWLCCSPSSLSHHPRFRAKRLLSSVSTLVTLNCTYSRSRSSCCSFCISSKSSSLRSSSSNPRFRPL